MANRDLFSSSRSQVPPANTINQAGGTAYEFANEHALAQYAITGTLNGTFYSSAETQLDKTRHTSVDLVGFFVVG